MPNKMTKCRFSSTRFTHDGITLACSLNNNAITDEICDKCNQFKSRYIEFPITVDHINNRPIDTTFKGLGHECGEIVEIRPCAEEYKNKSFIGIYIGDLPMMINSAYRSDEKTIDNYAVCNPAIFVPELKKIIFGAESFWRKLESIEDFKGISNTDIDNTWYIRLMKDMLTNEQN